MSELYKNLIEYAQSDYYPFHMPGHKRNIPEGVNPYIYDITEIDGFDNLHEPQGILRMAMEEAASFYESDKTYFLVNGSTCGLLSAISGTTNKGDKILVARNCHKAVYNAIYMNELNPEYVYPEYVETYGINGGVTKEEVRNHLNENRDIRVVVITSPTYEGIVSDINGIAEEIHAKQGILIVDEAHGAHFGMHSSFPQSALACGADIVIQSLHKTLPALTQTALLHIKGNRVNREKVERFLHIYQTSSPSYVLMSSITECINRIKAEGESLFELYVKRINAIKRQAKELRYLKLPGREIVGTNGIYDLDLSKLVMSVRGTGYTGNWVYEQMLEKYHIQLEMAAGDYALAMTSPMDTEEGFLRLVRAMEEVDRDITSYRLQALKSVIHYKIPKAIVKKNIYKAMNSDTQSFKLNCAEGRVAAEYIYLYPPGSPIIAPGERITKELIALLGRYKNSGLYIHGMREEDIIDVVWEG